MVERFTSATDALLTSAQPLKCAAIARQSSAPERPYAAGAFGANAG